MVGLLDLFLFAHRPVLQEWSLSPNQLLTTLIYGVNRIGFGSRTAYFGAVGS